MKKRILFIITQSEMGGAQRFLFNLLSRIRDRYDISVAIGSDGGDELTGKLKNVGIEATILKSLKRNISPVKDIKACYEIKNLLNKLKPDDLFLLSTKAGFLGSITARFFQLTAIPRVIYRIGGWTFNDPWPDWKKNLWIKLERESARWKDIIIVNNNHDLEQAKQLKIKPKEKLLSITNGIDTYKLDLLSRDESRLKLFEKLSEKHGEISQANILIGTVANFYPTKGLEILVETAEYFKNDERISFVIIGDGEDRKKLQNLIIEKGLGKKVFLIGKIDNAHRYMPAFDIFVLPSLKEGFPFALIEAMSAKVPVIATRVGAVPEIIDNGKNGFIVEPGNSASMAGKIKELLASDHLLKEFAIQGHQTVLFEFNEDRMIGEIEGVL